MSEVLTAYRRRLVQHDSLPDVFIQAYDELSTILYSAALAVEARDIEQKTAHVNRAMTLIAHLQSALDFEKGGKVAATLDRFYRLVRGDIIKGSAQLDAALLRQAAAHVLEIKKIWDQALALSSRQPSADPVQSGVSAPHDPANSPGPVSEDHASSRWTA